jgi:hypothetical protein
MSRATFGLQVDWLEIGQMARQVLGKAHVVLPAILGLGTSECREQNGMCPIYSSTLSITKLIKLFTNRSCIT